MARSSVNKGSMSTRLSLLWVGSGQFAYLMIAKDEVGYIAPTRCRSRQQHASAKFNKNLGGLRGGEPLISLKHCGSRSEGQLGSVRKNGMGLRLVGSIVPAGRGVPHFYDAGLAAPCHLNVAPALRRKDRKGVRSRAAKRPQCTHDVCVADVLNRVFSLYIKVHFVPLKPPNMFPRSCPLRVGSRPYRIQLRGTKLAKIRRPSDWCPPQLGLMRLNEKRQWCHQQKPQAESNRR